MDTTLSFRKFTGTATAAIWIFFVPKVVGEVVGAVVGKDWNFWIEHAPVGGVMPKLDDDAFT